MTYKKETCKYCDGMGTRTISVELDDNPGMGEIIEEECPKCKGNGFINVAEQPHLKTKNLINNKPLGTSARDRFNYGINK